MTTTLGISHVQLGAAEEREVLAVLRSGHKLFEYYIVDVTANGNPRVVPAF